MWTKECQGKEFRKYYQEQKLIIITWRDLISNVLCQSLSGKKYESAEETHLETEREE